MALFEMHKIVAPEIMFGVASGHIGHVAECAILVSCVHTTPRRLSTGDLKFLHDAAL